jgi:hypothetical protein
MVCDHLAPYQELFMYSDMFYIQWHNLAKKDLWNKVYMNMTMKLRVSIQAGNNIETG